MAKWLVLALLMPSLAWASATETLLAKLGGLRSMSGHFEQSMVNSDGDRQQSASGTMDVARGNRFYWKTEAPFEQLAVSDGKTVWVYDVDLEQVVVRPLTPDLGNTPALLFGGDPQRVGQAFEISELESDGANITYRLKPKGADPLFDTLDVTFHGDTPHSMRLRDALGQQTLIRFQDLTLNQSLPAARFSFTPPEGTDVIRQE